MPTEKFIYVLGYTVGDLLEYVCKATSGSNSSDPVWQISKLFYDVNENLIKIRYADGSFDFNKIADSKDTYRYVGDLETIISATANNLAFTTFDLTASGVGFTKSGDDGDIGASNSEFLTLSRVKILFGGVELQKGTEAIWVSSTSLKINSPLSIDHRLVIKS